MASFMDMALEEARAAGERGEVPVGCVIVRDGEVLARAGMAESATDALRKIKARSVKIDGELKCEPVLAIRLPVEFVVRVGRLMKRITIQQSPS